MAAKRKHSKAEINVDVILAQRELYRRPVAKQNVTETLRHTRLVLEKAARKQIKK